MHDHMESYASAMHRLLVAIDKLEVMGTRHKDWSATLGAATSAERDLTDACRLSAKPVIERAVRRHRTVRYHMTFTVWAPDKAIRFRYPATVTLRIRLYARSGRQAFAVPPGAARHEGSVSIAVPWQPDVAHAVMLQTLLEPAMAAVRHLPMVAR